MSETFTEHLNRLRQMSVDDGDTWDLSDNDRAALKTAVTFIEEHAEAHAAVLVALANSGIDTTCGACMEVAFTGVTTNAHTCASSSPPPGKPRT